MRIDRAVKRETIRIAVGTAAGTILMLGAFYMLHRWIPDKIPFDYRVFLGGICGAAVAVANFFLMGISVQKVTGLEDEKKAYECMKTSYHFRIAMQIIWMVLAIALPCFYGAAGIIPLFLPGVCIKAIGVFGTVQSE